MASGTTSEEAHGSFEWLTRLDQSFLVYEARESPMHVASTGIFDARPLKTPAGGVDLDRIRDYVLSRLHRIPRYRQRILASPLGGRPAWVDDERFNIRYHVRHSRLPRPGDERILKRVAGRILSQQLDLHKPLWEMWVVEGLEGDRFAVITKVHHCMIDGISGADLLAVLMSPEPVEKVELPPAWSPRPAPPGWRLAAGELWDTVRTPVQIAEGALRVLRDEDHARHDFFERARAAARLLETVAKPAPETAINRPVGPDRRVDWLAMDLDRVRAVKRRLGGTVNDVVLATVAGAVRRFLKHSRGEDVSELHFRIMAPVSVRVPSERGALGNRVAAWFLELPVDEPDPVRRLERVRETTEELKRSKQALGAEAITRMTEWTGTALLSLGSRLVHLGTPFNMVVTNVPGPRETLHLLEAPMLAVHPMVPLLGTLATGIALFSYRGELSWGFSGDWDLVPDLHDLVTAVEASFEQLARAAGVPERPEPGDPGGRDAASEGPAPEPAGREPAHGAGGARA